MEEKNVGRKVSKEGECVVVDCRSKPLIEKKKGLCSRIDVNSKGPIASPRRAMSA